MARKKPVNEFTDTDIFCGETITIDRDFVFTILEALSSLHARKCFRIGKSDDMEEATKLASQLENIVHIYNDVERLAAHIDGRDPQPLEC